MRGRGSVGCMAARRTRRLRVQSLPQPHRTEHWRFDGAQDAIAELERGGDAADADGEGEMVAVRCPLHAPAPARDGNNLTLHTCWRGPIRGPFFRALRSPFWESRRASRRESKVAYGFAWHRTQPSRPSLWRALPPCAAHPRSHCIVLIHRVRFAVLCAQPVGWACRAGWQTDNGAGG